MELMRIAQEMRPVIYKAGEIALQHFRNIMPEKKADLSFVTNADRAVEQYLRKEITERFPDHGFFGEEYGHNKIENFDKIWAIDPIDGTAPFVYELPVWAVSVGLITPQGGEIGFVYLPAIDELYWAVRGNGAFCNQHRLSVCPPRDFDKSSTIIGPSSAHRDYELSFPGRNLAFGSAASTLAFVSKGKVQGGLIDPVRLYDIAGGAVILSEADGEMRYLSGDLVNLWDLRDGRTMPESICLGHHVNVQKLIPMVKETRESNIY